MIRELETVVLTHVRVKAAQALGTINTERN